MYLHFARFHYCMNNVIFTAHSFPAIFACQNWSYLHTEFVCQLVKCKCLIRINALGSDFRRHRPNGKNIAMSALVITERCGLYTFLCHQSLFGLTKHTTLCCSGFDSLQCVQLLIFIYRRVYSLKHALCVHVCYIHSCVYP